MGRTLCFVPAGALRRHVGSYVDYTMTGWPAGRHRGLPDGCLTLVINLGSPIAVVVPHQAEVRAEATVGGLRTEPVEIVHDGTQWGVQIELTPRGARGLLGVPAAALAEGVWPLDEVIGRPAGELVERLRGAAGPTERAAVLDSVLTGWLRDHCYPASVQAVWDRLVATGGSIPVNVLADEMGWSRRHLSQLVRAELGLSPKAAARVLRFGRATQALLSASPTNLATVAAECGYFDQAHLAKEWKQLGGSSPSAWVADELPFLQAGAR